MESWQSLRLSVKEGAMVLKPEERAELTRIVQDLSQFSDTTGRRVLIELAGLQAALPELDLQGAPEMVGGPQAGCRDRC